MDGSAIKRNTAGKNVIHFLRILFAMMVILCFSQALCLAAKGGTPGKPGTDEEEAANNLSFPVIWTEGVSKSLPGIPDMTPVITGQWWYWWGTDEAGNPLSCPPDPDNSAYCDDNIPNMSSWLPPGDGWVRAYLQKDPGNVWQAENQPYQLSAPLIVDWIDWGDNLESVDWYIRSMVRTEVVLYQDLSQPMREYQMRHLSGWGIDEVHGLAVDHANEVLLGSGTQATLYSPCARLTIQKLLINRDDPQIDGLEWDTLAHRWVVSDPSTQLINDPIFTKAVYESGDGPGYYAAEINVKGKIIYGYTWNVRQLNEGAGDYRITFSFDGSFDETTCGVDDLNNPVYLQTFFDENAGTRIMVPEEEATVVTTSIESDSDDSGGAIANIDSFNNLTYIDVRIKDRNSGGRKGK